MKRFQAVIVTLIIGFQLAIYFLYGWYMQREQKKYIGWRAMIQPLISEIDWTFYFTYEECVSSIKDWAQRVLFTLKPFKYTITLYTKERWLKMRTYTYSGSKSSRSLVKILFISKTSERVKYFFLHKMQNDLIFGTSALMAATRIIIRDNLICFK